MIEKIRNNPFRTLGVYANSPQRDIVANKGKMNAFLRVGKSVAFPLDLGAILGPVVRTSDSLTAADSQLSIEQNKVEAAQFWFFNCSSYDVIATEKLKSRIDDALDIWQQSMNMSSLQNAAICLLIKGNYHEAAMKVAKVYTQYYDQFISAIGTAHRPTLDTLVATFVNTLTESVPQLSSSELSGPGFPKAWNNVAGQKMVEPMVARLRDAVDECKLSKGKTPRERLEAGKKLGNVATPLINNLRRMLPSDDVVLVGIADKVANEILQCSIDYFNDASSADAAYETQQLLIKAKSFVMGSMVMQRIQDNEKTLNGILGDLPPAKVMAEFNAVQDALKRFCEKPDEMQYSDILLEETREPLASMKRKIGGNHSAYINLSTKVVNNALHNIIEEINSKQKQSGIDIFTLRALTKRALGIVTKLKNMDMDDATRERLEKNYSTLQSIIYDLNADHTPDYTASSGSSDDEGCLTSIGKFIFYLILLALISALRISCN